MPESDLAVERRYATREAGMPMRSVASRRSAWACRLEKQLCGTGNRSADGWLVTEVKSNTLNVSRSSGADKRSSLVKSRSLEAERDILVPDIALRATRRPDRAYPDLVFGELQTLPEPLSNDRFALVNPCHERTSEAGRPEPNQSSQSFDTRR